MRLPLLILLLGIYCSCKNPGSIKRIRVDDLIAEGEISKDTVYNGLIKFYDTGTGKLIQSVNYEKGIAKGERRDYYGNGQVKLKLNYDDGKINGEVFLFDQAGKVTQTQNRYYDVRVGSSIEYKDNNVSQYYFYSFENQELLHINYDSIQGKRVEQLNDTIFFFSHLSEFSTSESDRLQTQLFLYLPNPPKLNFVYSICIIDDKYVVKETLKDFSTKESWGSFNIDSSLLKTSEKFAIRLMIDNEFDNDDRIATMFKKL